MSSGADRAGIGDTEKSRKGIPAAEGCRAA